MRKINWDDLPCLDPAELTEGKKTALTIGVFDGLHRGHQALIAKITEKAPEFLPVLVTFRGNPKKIRKKKGEPFREIISFEEKTALLSSYGIELCVIIDFSANFSTINGRAFMELVNRYLRPAYISLGVDFHCGHRRDTDAKAFKALAEGLGIKAEIVPPVLEKGLPVSSSRIRKALQAHKYEEVSLLLGRPLKTV